MKKQNIIMIVIIAIIAVIVIGVGVKLHQGNSASSVGPSAVIEQEVSLSTDQIEVETDEAQNVADTQTSDTENTDTDIDTKDDAKAKDDTTSESKDDKHPTSDSNNDNSASNNGSVNASSTTDNSTFKDDSENSSAGESDNTSTVPEEETLTCTVTIKCDTILNNMANLTPGKEGLVPSSGYLLGKTTIEFEPGDTAFDVTKEACANAGIQIEYAYTPAYGSYYVEGIGNLYEFDCGSDSGWMYKVNGWFPNYGCSSYELEDGDNIVWCYTCNGLGADVGASNR